ncbi:MAG: hypothetical protein HY078_17370 [Elusimicrobia bacterium]|nr:hypothetical protein [Elusimicrobiota bacterium]
MVRYRGFIAGAAFLLIVGAVARLASETMTMTTYYPSPSGIYRRLVATGEALLARDSGNVVMLQDNASGKVGIGTKSPKSKLHVNGGILPGEATSGDACSPEGAFAYDFAAHAPVVCGASGRWGPMGGGGALVQNRYAETAAWGSFTVQPGWGDQVPQSNQGTQILSLGFTPKSAANRLQFRVTVPFGLSSSGACGVVALFDSSSSDALYATDACPAPSEYDQVLSFAYEKTAGSTDPTSFTVRVGPTGGAFYLNGRRPGVGRLLGGVQKATLVVQEIIP